MPDLTIKPNVGNGNKVIIQDQAGGAVLTTADSGATMDGSVIKTGTISNTVQDNITRLGTVTSGNLSNTAIVRPSSSILQILSNNYNSQTQYSSQIQICPVTITTLQASSSFYYMANLTIGGVGDSNNTYLTISKSTGGTASASDLLPADNRAPGTGAQNDGRQLIVDVMVQSGVHNSLIFQTYNFSDTIVGQTHAAGTQLTFAMWLSGGAYINRPPGRADYETGVTSLTIMEIGG